MDRCTRQAPVRLAPVVWPYSEVKDATPCLGGGNVMVVAGEAASFFPNRYVVIKDVHADFGLDAWSEKKAVMLHAAKLTSEAGGNWDMYITSRKLGYPVRAGNYAEAERAGFESKGRLGFSLTGAGTACNSSSSNVNISEIRWVGEHVSSLTATFAHQCDGDEARVTGCVHVDNPLLLQAERDLRGAPAAAPNENTAYQAHDPGPCLGGGSRFFVEADRAHGAMRHWPSKRSLTFTQPKTRIGASTSQTALRLDIEKRGEVPWHLTFSAKKPLSVGPFYAAVAGHVQASGDAWLAVGHESCGVDVARFRLHDLDLAKGSERGTVTFEIQCRRRNAVLRGCVHFEPEGQQ
ncbi:MAG TPA: hypothetical protein VJN18_01680 [Polyangiaceae bacterium]|nr:hypothetical protein [Polyangiaceae bacterium]